jgi:hypothetical protein
LGFGGLSDKILDYRIREIMKYDLLSAKGGSHKDLLWVQIFRKENRRSFLEFFREMKGERSCACGTSDLWVEEGCMASPLHKHTFPIA